jgi:2-methylisocitrate lyase-like PEP mutase family enzyme
MIQIEDQGFPKRCGHLDGKTVVPAAEMCGKLRAALDCRRNSDTLILARTDAVAVEGIAAALERAEVYLACGVDALFVEALRSADEIDAVCTRFASRVALLATWSRAARRRCETPRNSARAAFASSSFLAARRAQLRMRCRLITAA